MKRPSMYNRHEDSLKTFTDIFNSYKDDLPLIMQVYHTENYRDDGVIVDTKSGKRITFDWEYRDKYFKSGKFRFKDIGQFERKLKKDEIGLSLQCDSDETAVLAAWHEDWLKEQPQAVRLSTDYNYREKGEVRYTAHFEIYRYREIRKFRQMIAAALRSGTFNHQIFESV